MNKERANGYYHANNNNNNNFCQQLFPKGDLECLGIFPALDTCPPTRLEGVLKLFSFSFCLLDTMCTRTSA